MESQSRLYLVSAEVSGVWRNDAQPPQATMATFSVVGRTQEGTQRLFSLLAMREAEYAQWRQEELELMGPEETATTPLMVTEERLAGEGLTQHVIIAYLNPENDTSLDRLLPHLEEVVERTPEFGWASAEPIDS